MKQSTILPISAGPRHGAELFSIQYLRALAALGVVVFHAATSLLDHERYLIPTGAGNAGVDIFFVISGFIMYYTTVDRAITSSQFYLRRIIRIVPLYFGFSTLAFFLARLAPLQTRNFSPRVSDYLRSIFFIPYFSSTVTGPHSFVPLIRPEVGQGWTLNYEMFFYALFGACLWLPARLRVPALAAACVLLTIAGVLTHPTGAMLSTYTDPLLLEFIFGVVLGYVFVRLLHGTTPSPGSRSRSAVFGAVLATASVAALVFQNFSSTGLPRAITYGLPALGLVGGSLLLERAGHIPRVSFLLLLGNASYSLYLLHIFVLAILRRVWQHEFRVDRIASHASFILVAVIITELAAICVFLYAEKPTTGGLSRVLKKHGILRVEGRNAAALPGQKLVPQLTEVLPLRGGSRAKAGAGRLHGQT